jgi:hypothetical protein
MTPARVRGKNDKSGKRKLQRVTFATIAVKPDTKERLERLRKQRRAPSMDELIKEAIHEMEMEPVLRRIRARAKGWENAPRDPVIEDAEEALQDLEETLRRTRGRPR